MAYRLDYTQKQYQMAEIEGVLCDGLGGKDYALVS